MKCIRFTKYGQPEVLEVVECEKPKVGKNDVLIKVMYSSVQAADWRIRSMNLPRGMKMMGRLAYGVFRPRVRVLGTELSGVIEDVGAEVSEFQIGDEVVAVMGASLGAHAQYVALKKNSVIVKKPKAVSFQEAAVTSFGTQTALHFLKSKVDIQKGQKVLVHGASGPVGLAAVQVAKSLGAQVTAVCREENFELVRSLGVDHCIDYNKEDFRHSPAKYDFIFDVTGFLNASNTFSALKEQGQLILISGTLYEILSSFFINMFSSKKVVVGVATETKQNLQSVLADVASGKLKIVIDREYNMNEVVQAHRYAEARHRKGSIALKMSPS